MSLVTTKDNRGFGDPLYKSLRLSGSSFLPQPWNSEDGLLRQFVESKQ